MRKRYVKQGDRTTAQGVILEGMTLLKCQGTPIAFIGAQVYCPACESHGVIAADGPHLPDNIGGRHAALEGDLCLCKCSPPPRTVASQSIMYQTLTAAAPTTADEAAPSAEDAGRFDDHYVIRGTSGRPLAHVAYVIEHAGGAIERGTTDAQGRTHLLRKTAEAIGVRIYAETAE